MGNLFHWECIRARYNRQTLSVFLIILALMILSVQTERTFFPVITKRIKMLSMFQIYTQFGFLFLGYVYIRGFTMDSKNGTFPFVQQIGYSFRAIMGMKSVIYIVTTIVYMDIVTVTYAMIAGIQDLDYILLMIIPLDLGIITLILFDLLISVIFMQVSLAYVIHILIFFLADIANRSCYGLLNQFDTNSLATVVFRHFSGVQINHPTLSKLSLHYQSMKWIYMTLPSIVWIFILLMILFPILLKKERR